MYSTEDSTVPSEAPSGLAVLAAGQEGEGSTSKPSTSLGLGPLSVGCFRGRRKTWMDHDFGMQPRGAPGPETSFSRSLLLGRPAHPSRLPGGVPPLIPVLRKTIRLDAFPQSHLPQASGRPGLGAGARSVPPQETSDSLVPRKLSSISLTLRQNSQAWGEGSTPGRETATHGRGRLPILDSSSVTLVSGGRVRSEGPGNPGLAKASRMPTVEKPLVSSYLALPFQSRLGQNPAGPAGPGSVGQRHPVPMTAQVPTRASPGRGKSRSRGIPRPRLHLQRPTPTTGPAMATDWATLDTRPGTVRHLAPMATNRPSLAVNLAAPNHIHTTSRPDTGTEFPALDVKLGTATELATAGTAKQGLVQDLITPDPDKRIATAGTAKPYPTTGATAVDLAAPHPVKVDTARPDRVLASDRANPDITMGSLALCTSRLGIATGVVVPVTLNPAIRETTLDSAINLTTSDTVTYPLMSSRSTDPALDRSTADAATDLARKTKGKCKELGRGCTGLLGVGRGTRVVAEGPGDGEYLDRSEREDSKVRVKCAGGKGHRVEGQNTGDTPGAGSQPASQNHAEGSHQKGGLRG